MAFKAIVVLCASALMVSAISGQCIGSLNSGYAGNGLIGYGTGLGLGSCNNGLGGGYGNIGSLASSGGEFIVSSVSPISPTGISVVSENALEGVVNVVGALPFLSAVALEGQVPSGGSAGASYSCGNGQVGIVSAGGAAAGGLGYGAGLANVGLAGGYGNIGLAGGCGCNRLY